MPPPLPAMRSRIVEKITALFPCRHCIHSSQYFLKHNQRPPTCNFHDFCKTIPRYFTSGHVRQVASFNASSDVKSPNQPQNSESKLQSCPVSELNLEQFLKRPPQSIEDLLSLDVRPLPSAVRLDCLGLIMEASRNAQIKSTKTGISSTIAKHLTYEWIFGKHAKYSNDLELGVNPVLMRGSEPEWLKSDRFELLVLTTVGCAIHLNVQQLLRLAGHLQHIWWYFDPKVYAAVIRLITNQVNETSLQEIFQLAALVYRLQSSEAELMTDPRSDEESMQQLRQEFGLLRRALIIHAVAKISDTEDCELVSLLGFIEHMHTFLSPEEKDKLKNVFDRILRFKSRQLDLHSIIFICPRLSLLDWPVNYLFSKLLARIEHKLLSEDGLPYAITCLSAMATLHVGSPEVTIENVNRLDLLACPPVVPEGISLQGISQRMLYPGLDLKRQLKAAWMEKCFMRATSQAILLPENSSETSGPGRLAAFAYNLALLGYRARNIVDSVYLQQRPLPEGFPPYLDLVDLLVSTGSLDVPFDMNLVRWLPRVEWQYYYKLANEARKNTLSPDDSLFSDYKYFKLQIIEKFMKMFRSRIKMSGEVQALPFCRFRAGKQEGSYFADVLIAKESSVLQGSTKLAMCFVCSGRDFVVGRPLNVLVDTYRSNEAGIPVLAFDINSIEFAENPQVGLDSFLKELARVMMDSPAVPTDSFEVLSTHAW